jgi:hypothetical protein
MAGWSKLTQVELRALLQVLGQPTGGSKAALVQRLAAFMDSDCEAAGDRRRWRASASEVAELEAAGARTELDAWRTANAQLDELTTSLAKHRAQARAAELTQQGPAMATVKAAAAAARASLHAFRVQHNERTCQLLQLVGQDDLRSTFMRAEVWGVVGLWRLRSVCRAFCGWAQAELSSLPRVVAVGGLVIDRSVAPTKNVATSSVESLVLATMRWSAAGCMPSLLDPRCFHSVSCGSDGRVVVCGGRAGLFLNAGDRTAFQWLPGTNVWSTLPDLPAGRLGAVSVRLPDGRTMLIGGWSSDEGQALASVVVLAADGSGWAELPRVTEVRAYSAAAVLPDGKVLVAGGTLGADIALNTAELWDPATQKWTALPPMVHKRTEAVACLLPSGRVAVLGGCADGVGRKDGEVFDPVKCEWEPLGAEMAHVLVDVATVPVAGGLVVVGLAQDDVSVTGGVLAVGGTTRPELYDEECRRWFRLPHAMVEPRSGGGLAVSVPASALIAATVAH